MPTELLTVAAARERIASATGRLDHELVALADAPLGRVLAQDVRAAGDAPRFACSAMDGYAIKAGPEGRALELVGESRAGAPSATELGAGQAIRISTGAALPAGAEAVIRQEDTEHRDGSVLTAAPTAVGANVRLPGEDMRADSVVLTNGTRLRAAEIGAAVAAGAGEVSVARRPQVRVLCTGDELREPGAPLAPGQIHNSNGPMLVALSRQVGAIASPAGMLPDRLEATIAALASALAASDVVLISGGVSVGPHDHVKPALARLGVTERFWGVALQPGKPTWFGTDGQKLVFGLPGNPVSAFVTFTLFAAPALGALQGDTAAHERPQAALTEPVLRHAQREQAIRVRLRHERAALLATPNGPQGSHVVSSLTGADALALIPRGSPPLASGELVELIALPR